MQLPAVLQAAGQAAVFGMIAGLSEQGLSFDCQGAAPQAVGDRARIEFDFQGRHYSCPSLIIHVQGRRALLSLREAPADALAALHSARRHGPSHRAVSLSVLQSQYACHARFMDSMQGVVDAFYQMLPGAIHQDPALAADAGARDALQRALTALRPALTRQFTQTYPMYPELRGAHPQSPKTAAAPQAVDMERVDDWIRRSAIAHRVAEAIDPLPGIFNRHYGNLLKREDHKVHHPYLPETVLDVLADLIDPLGLGAAARTLCYELLAQALQNEVAPLYQAMLQIIAEALPDFRPVPGEASDLALWLKEAARHSGSVGIDGLELSAAALDQLGELTARVAHLTENLGDFSALAHRIASVSDRADATQALIPGLLARDRILARFFAALPPPRLDAGLPSPLPDGAPAPSFAPHLGGLTDLDSTALEALYAQLMQPPTIDPGPEKLAQASQVRALMLQAQGLLLEYTLNGLTYQAQPGHPVWVLINALDALHRGADDRGQFLDPALYKTISLAMQWLLNQEDSDAALDQVNALLARINADVLAGRRSRRAQTLSTLGAPAPAHPLINTGWCVVKRDAEVIPHEVLGKYNGLWVLLNRSATDRLEIPAERFIRDIDANLIEEAGSYDEPFLERIANTTLTASLNAVHAFTWQDPGSGCLKRAALMDELERRLAHPVTEPATFCALLEIPTMRPSLSSLPGDELAVMQKRTGEILLEALESGEHCGRLSDVSFMMVFSPQHPERLVGRLSRLKAEMEGQHPEWKMVGAVVPLVGDAASPTPSNMLRRANQACAPQRQQAGFDLSCLGNLLPPTNQITPLPFSSLFLRCQKIESCDDGAPSHYEILLGVDDDLAPRHTTQSFVVMAEQTGRIHDLDLWVLRSVLEWMDRNGAEIAHLSGLSVNLSGASLTFAQHLDAMAALLARYPRHAQKLIFEVTETAAIDNMDLAVGTLRKLRELGCRIALDDFGSGYSSYGYLRSLPLDYLKIDGTYIRNILTDKTNQALTASMVDVAHALGLKVIAEYVDNEAAYAWLKAQGVDYVQGYWVHRPERLDTHFCTQPTASSTLSLLPVD